MANPPEQNEADPEDYTYHIEELRKIIEDAPPGYQAKFARVIASLNQRRLRVSAITSFTSSGEKEVNYKRLLEMLRAEIEESSDSSSRFSAAMEIAKTREKTVGGGGEREEDEGGASGDGYDASATDNNSIVIFEGEELEEKEAED
ncbi:MAG: hypothetical protein ACTSU5_20650 [Promethearchaeota archaeon]